MNFKLFLQQLHYPKYIRRHTLKMQRLRQKPVLKDKLGALETVVHPWDRKEYYACIRGIYFHLASFYNKKSFEKFLKRFGLHLVPRESRYETSSDICQVRERFVEGYFWNRLQVPLFVHRIRLLSNGRYVTGYWRRRGDTIEVYRPNPNAWLVYDPVKKIKDVWHIQETQGVF